MDSVNRPFSSGLTDIRAVLKKVANSFPGFVWYNISYNIWFSLSWSASSNVTVLLILSCNSVKSDSFIYLVSCGFSDLVSSIILNNNWFFNSFKYSSSILLKSEYFIPSSSNVEMNVSNDSKI